MKLSADTVNGVQIVSQFYDLPTANYGVLKQDLFYSCLKDLDDNELILTETKNLSFLKKLHREYGINR